MIDDPKRKAREAAAPASGRAAWRIDEMVIGVDADDNEIGPISRAEAHNGQGVLHRAFMVLLLDSQGRILIARRSGLKRLWPGIWADSCAGHPLPGQDLAEAANKRLVEELGCSATLTPIGRFIYRAQWGGAGTEYESCHVFVGRACSEIKPDPAEVSEVEYISREQLDEEIAARRGDFAPWLVDCLRAVTIPTSI